MASSSVTYLGKDRVRGATVDRLHIDPSGLPAEIDRVVIGAILDGTGTFGGLDGLAVEVAAGPGAPPVIRCDLTAEREVALIFAEVYRRGAEWKIRAVGQGYADGLPGLAADYGVSLDAEPRFTRTGRIPSTPADERAEARASWPAQIPAPVPAQSFWPAPMPAPVPVQSFWPPRIP